MRAVPTWDIGQVVNARGSVAPRFGFTPYATNFKSGVHVTTAFTARRVSDIIIIIIGNLWRSIS